MRVTSETPIYRITHMSNVPWILNHGLHAQSMGLRDPAFIPIGDPDLIEKRRHRVVVVDPGGTLDDYVTFYFGVHSVMLYAIHTRRVLGVAVTQRDVVYLVSSVERVRDAGARFVFTDRHAYVANAEFFSDLAELKTLDWARIRGRDFRRDPNRPDKLERRAAEFLVHRYLPVSGLIGFGCYDDAVCARIRAEVDQRGLDLRAESRRAWYF